MNKRKFYSGVSVLALAGIIVKLFGFAFRIPLGRMIMAGGMGDYAPAYDVYGAILVIATAGLPVAISRMVSDRVVMGKNDEAHRVFVISRKIMAGIGLCGFLLLFFGADYIAEVVKISSSAPAIKAISPALLLAPVMSSYRGYFQGLQEMTPTAVSQISEQLFRVVFGLLAAYLMFNEIIFPNYYSHSGTLAELQTKGAAGACFGAAAGAFFGLIAIMEAYRRRSAKCTLEIRNYKQEFSSNPQKNENDRRLYEVKTAENDDPEPTSKIVKQILAIAAPITIAACIMPLVNLADVTIVMRRLTAIGFEYESAKAMFGELTSFAAPIIAFPQILIQAFVVSLVPLIARVYRTENRDGLEESIKMGFASSMLLTMPCAAGLFVLSEPIMKIMFGDQVQSASACLAIYSIAFIFLSTSSIATAMLQGIGKQNLPVINLFAGVVVKIAVTWTLSGIYQINVKGAALGTLAAYITSSSLDIFALKRSTRCSIGLVKAAAKPLVASIIMGVLAYGVYRGLYALLGSMALACAAAILTGAAVYAVEVIKGGIITEDEIAALPKGDYILKIYKI